MDLSSENLLLQQFNQLTLLLTLLEREKEILQKHSPEDLIAIGQEKNNLLLNVQETDDQISKHPSFAKEKSAGLHQEMLDKIADLLRQCKDKNTVNGMIIQQSQIAVERMKTSLLVSNNRTSVTYDSKGKASGNLKSLGFKA